MLHTTHARAQSTRLETALKLREVPRARAQTHTHTRARAHGPHCSQGDYEHVAFGEIIKRATKQLKGCYTRYVNNYAHADALLSRLTSADKEKVPPAPHRTAAAAAVPPRDVPRRGHAVRRRATFMRARRTRTRAGSTCAAS